jgi:hypothetical protein
LPFRITNSEKTDLLWVYEGLESACSPSTAAISPDVMHEALRAHKDSRVPLQSIVANEEYVKVVDVAASSGNAFRTCCATRRNPPSWRNLRAKKCSARSQNRPRHGRPLKRRKILPMYAGQR